MHGTGNDFVMIDAISQPVKLSPNKIRKIADRHFGIGCDQLLIAEIPDQPDVDFRYRIYNQDGTEVEQCGNGARCFGKFVRDRKLSARNPVRVQTLGGNISIYSNTDRTHSVDMGVPVFEPSEIPLTASRQSDEYTIDVDGTNVNLSSVSLGNPHAVIRVDNIDQAPLETLGAKIENHSSFPNRVNVGFMEVVDRDEIKLRVYERGVGETLACGTGACAAVVCGIKLGVLDHSVKVVLSGGELRIDWAGDNEPVRLTGPAKTVFHGQIRL